MDKRTLETYKKKLSPAQYNVCFLAGTEPPFSGKYTDNHDEGMYACAVCGHELFSSATKYDSGTGWPAFWNEAKPGCVILTQDTSLGMHRTEVQCAFCNAHLGHVFRGGPKDPPRLAGTRRREAGKTGIRYCINSLALEFMRK